MKEPNFFKTPPSVVRYVNHECVEIYIGLSWCIHCGILKTSDTGYLVHDKNLPYKTAEEPFCAKLV